MIDFDTIAKAIISTRADARIEIVRAHGCFTAVRIPIYEDVSAACVFGRSSTPTGAIVELLAKVEAVRREERAAARR